MSYEFNVGAWAMVHWIYSTSGESFAKLVFGEAAHPNYLHEKAMLWAKSPVRALGYLDEEHRLKVLKLVADYRKTAEADVPADPETGIELPLSIGFALGLFQRIRDGETTPDEDVQQGITLLEEAARAFYRQTQRGT